jgi:hypothetical protein
VTAIDEVRSEPSSDNNLFYSLQGVATNNPTHGVYVHQGKKVLF